jgi:hypothetical protein
LRGLAAACVLCAASAALAFDPFEIQIYDGTADAPGEAGLEIHLNRHHDATHLTFEPSVGVTRFWEIGGYLQTQQGHYEGVKLRSKFVTPEGALGHLRLGINFEVSLEPGGNTGGEIRPILAFEDARFILAANPIVSFPGPNFEPGAMAKVKAGPIAMGLEYYGTLPDQHYLLAAVDLLAVKHLEVNAGVGGGSAPVAKLIVGYAF